MNEKLNNALNEISDKHLQEAEARRHRQPLIQAQDSRLQRLQQRRLPQQP